MTEFLTEFHFLRPWWLVGFIPALLIVILAWRHKNTSNSWTEHIDTHLFAILSSGEKTKKSLYESLFWALFSTLALIALAGPTWEKIELPVSKNQNATVILWDLSPSMEVADIKPSRLVRSRHKLKDLLRSKKDGLTALVVYSGDVHTVTPLTEDVRTISSLLDSLSPAIMPAKGSNIEEAFERAVSLLEQHSHGSGNIVILTDGISRDAEQSLIELSRAKRHKITVWGVGSEAGAPIPVGDGRFARNNRGEIVIAGLDQDYLSALALNLGGRYVSLTGSDDDLNEIKASLETSKDNSSIDEQDSRQFDAWEEYGRFLLIPILIAFAFSFRRGWVLPLFIVGFGISTKPSYALNIDSIVKTRDQRAQEAMSSGDYNAASELFEKPDWKAAAAYKSGEFEQAEEYYRSAENSQDLFNLGNTLVQQGKYEDALAAYDRALKSEPGFQAAERNKSITEKLIEAREKNNQDQNNENGESTENNESGEKGQQNNSEQKSGDSSNQENSSEDNAQQSQDSGAEPEQSETDQSANNESETDDSNSDSHSDASAGELDENQEALDQHYSQSENEENAGGEEERTQESRQQAQQENQQDQQQALSNMESVDERLSEADQALEQWLRKVPDDPGRLMRNKFAQQYRQKQRDQNSKAWRKPPNEENRW